MIPSVSRVTLLATAFALGGMQSAAAIEPDDFADALVQAGTFLGLALSYGTAEIEGDTVTVSGLSLLVPGEGAFEIERDIVFEGVTEAEDGSYTVARATIEDIEHGDEWGFATVTLANIAVEGLWLPSSLEPADFADFSFHFYDRISAGPLTVVDPDGVELGSIASLESWVSDTPDASGAQTSGYALSEIRVDLGGAMPAPEVAAIEDAFGTTVFTGSVSGSGLWWLDTGRTELEGFTLVLDDLASLSATIAVEGYTRAVVEAMTAASIELAEMARADVQWDDEQMLAINMEMFDLMAGLALESGSIRYADDSLFEKALDYAATAQGTRAETLRGGLKFMAAMALSEIENTSLRTMIATAINSFIDDPQSLEISVSPDTPLAFTTLETLDLESDPYGLAEILNLEVRANQ